PHNTGVSSSWSVSHVTVPVVIWQDTSCSDPVSPNVRVPGPMTYVLAPAIVSLLSLSVLEFLERVTVARSFRVRSRQARSSRGQRADRVRIGCRLALDLIIHNLVAQMCQGRSVSRLPVAHRRIA